MVSESDPLLHSGDDQDEFGKDQPEHVTFSRRVARFLSRYHWYHPRTSPEADDGPSKHPHIDSAWAYFEHMVLPRRFAHSDVKGDLQKAEPGETSETRLYSVCSTPEKDLTDLGVGIGIYFFTLRCLAIVLLLAGLINIPNILFYQSDYYNDDEAGGVPHVLKASAICTDNYWAPCPTCEREQWDYFPHTYDRYAETSDGKYKFIKVNLCSFSYFLGFFNWISILFTSVALYVVFFFVIKKREVKYDEARQTSTDYSVSVENPPTDARDAEKWRDFFSQFGHVTCCTVAVDNEELVKALVERRTLMTQMDHLLPHGVAFDKFDLDLMAEKALPLAWWQKMMFSSTGEQLRSKIAKLDEEIMELSEIQPDVANVFITFETEEAQRAALKQLTVRRWDSLTNNVSALPKSLLYDGKHILNVEEPPEPSAVRWQDLDDSVKRTLSTRFVAFTILLTFIACGMIFITYCRFHYGPARAALVISILNSASPTICSVLTEYETHRSEDEKETSRYVKTTISMFSFTAVVVSLVTPFTDTVSNSSDSVLYSLYAIYVFELLRGPITQCADISGNLKRHVLGPRVRNMLKRTALFQGTAYELSERYTNMTNVLFLTFYYGTIFPVGYFFCALTLCVHYWTDKYCLLRVWAPEPHIGTRLSVFCRSFVAGSLVILAVMSSYYVAGFPFDNACKDSDNSQVPSDYLGKTFAAKDGYEKEISISVDENESSYFFCNMNMAQYSPRPAFPAWASNQPVGGEWMEEDQEHLSWFFGWTSVVALVLIVCIFLRRVVFRFLKFMFFGQEYTPEGEPSEDGFSDIKVIFAYVPQVQVPSLPLPVLVCNINGISRELIGWNDPINDLNYHNAIYDIPEITEKDGIFSAVSHWPPPTAGKK